MMDNAPLVGRDPRELRAMRRSADLLFTSILCFGLGSLLGVGLGTAKWLGSAAVNLRGESFPSGYSYVPGQISYMCRDPSTPEGICFRGFLLVGAICLLISQYPWMLSNVNFSPASPGCIGNRRRQFLTMRTLVPTLAMMIVVLVHLPFDAPDQESNFGNTIQNAVHSTAAVVMFLGYALFELATLLCGKFTTVGQREKKLRWILMWGSLLSLVGFMIPYNLVTQAEQLGLCCADVWRVPTLHDARTAQSNGHLGTMVADWQHNETITKMLSDTAYGTVRVCKLLALVFEVVDGVCVGGSLFVIWYFCPERKIDA